jgi:hypothetical protein
LVDIVLLYLFRKQVTRFLHKKRKILHRDISSNNVRLRDVVQSARSSADNDVAPVVPANPSAGNDLLASSVPANTSSVDKDPSDPVPAEQSITEELGEMCFASHLLHMKSNSRSVLSSKVLASAHFYSTGHGRLDTRVLLIDFDMSEDQEPGNQGDDKKAPHARTVWQYPDMR